MVVLTGAALVAASQVQAALSYSDGDLLLNFRDITSSTPPNLTVDEGNINTFLSSVSAGTTTELVSSTTLTGALTGAGAGDQIGFSAGAGTTTAISGAEADTLWLTRVIPAGQLTGSGLTASAKQLASTQGNTDTILYNIGQGMIGGTAVGGLTDAATVSGGNANSYASQAVNAGTMNYNTAQSTTAGAGGALEGVQTASSGADVYEALWEVQPSTKGTGVGGPADTYEGYFTFQPDGEVDFTAASSVPEPSTYGLIAGAALLALAFRRQIRSVTA